MQAIQRNRHHTPKNTPPSNRRSGSQQSAAPCSALSSIVPLKMEGLLPLWSGPSLNSPVIRRYMSSLRAVNKFHRFISPVECSGQYPDCIVQSLRQVQGTLDKIFPTERITLKVEDSGPNAGLIQQCHFYSVLRVCYLPIEHVLDMYLKKVNLPLAKMLLSTFAYLYKYCRIGVLDANTMGCDMYEYITDAYTDSNEPPSQEIIAALHNSQIRCNAMREILNERHWLKEWDAHLAAFRPCGEIEWFLKIGCAELRGLLQHFPEMNIYKGWYKAQDEDVENVYPDSIYTFADFAHAFSIVRECELSEDAKESLERMIDDFANMNFDNTLDGLLYSETKFIFHPHKVEEKSGMLFHKALYDVVSDFFYLLNRV